MGEDWQIGDLALCVKKAPWLPLGKGNCPPDAPKAGDIRTVSELHYELGLVFLKFEGMARGKFNQCEFRKIRPSAIEHIEALKRVPVPSRENEHA